MTRVSWNFFREHLAHAGYDIRIAYPEGIGREVNYVRCPECGTKIKRDEYPVIMAKGTMCRCPICFEMV